MNGTERRWSLRVLKLVTAMVMLVTIVAGSPAGGSVDVENAGAPKKLVILGASYAKSWGTPPLPGFAVVNRGVGGEQTAAMRARFQRDVVSARPDVVLIWGHINNITQSGAATAPDRAAAVKASAREDYASMLEQARAAGIEVILATEIPLAEPDGLVDQARALLGRLRGKESYAAKVNAQVRDLNAFVRQQAGREGFRLLDFELVFAPAGGARKSEYATEDRSHVTPAGYRALTDYAVRELSRRR